MWPRLLPLRHVVLDEARRLRGAPAPLQVSFSDGVSAEARLLGCATCAKPPSPGSGHLSPSSTPRQRHIKLRAASSLGQSRPDPARFGQLAGVLLVAGQAAPSAHRLLRRSGRGTAARAAASRRQHTCCSAGQLGRAEAGRVGGGTGRTGRVRRAAGWKQARTGATSRDGAAPGPGCSTHSRGAPQPSHTPVAPVVRRPSRAQAAHFEPCPPKDELLTLGVVSGLQRPERRSGVQLDRRLDRLDGETAVAVAGLGRASIGIAELRSVRET